MQLRYAFRMYPDAGQRAALARAFGCARVVFNDAVRAREDARKAGTPFPKAGELSTRLITEAKRTDARSWLGEVSAVVLQQSLRDAEAAYKNFFASLKGTRKGPKLGAPRFYVTVFLFLMMMSLPIKMLLRWIFNLKYIVAIPEIFFNI